MMVPSQVALDLIKQFEGFRRKVYRCPGGYWTIGYGHVLRAAEELAEVTQDEAEILLCQDAGIAGRAVNRLIHVPLTQNQFDALVSFTFNVGAGALQRSTLRRIINREEHTQVPQELMKWVRAGGQVMPGLVRRRERESGNYT
jgi:GH24 family phage-related lysozyme (muramidase)